MILESIEISNIRSIRNETITFPSSTMLFFGDVGSGKSSVLKSIEFALFGTLTHGDLSGDSLLRRGKGNASVKLTLLIDSKKYSIKRSLSKDRRGKVSQKECIFTDHDNGTSITYAPTDMRRKILSLLSYSVSRYEKATKLPLFRYTVYTPQEQIKEIIQAEPDDRFEILKEVFGIEKYEITLRNIDFIKDFLNDKVKEYKIRIEQIGDPEEKILQQKKEIEQTNQKIIKIENEISTKEKDITSQETVVEELQKDLDNFSKKFAQIENKELNITTYRAEQKKSKASLNKIQKEVVEKEEQLKKLKDVVIHTDLSEPQLESLLEQSQNSISQKEKERAVLKKVLTDVDKLLKEGKCALCGQAIHEKDRFEKEFQEAEIKVGNLTSEIDGLLSKVNEQKNVLKIKRESQKIKNKKDSLNNLISEKRKRLTDLNSRINDLFVNINSNQEDIIAILSKYENASLLKFKGMGEEIKVKLKAEKKALNERKSGKESSGKELSANNKTLEYLQKELAEINSNMKLKKEIQGDLTYYTQLKNWVGEGFPVLIRDIEKRILSSTAHHFNSYFKEWFHELVEDRNIEVEIKTDDFQPIVHVNGYESPFKDLSGGEKSALSLAYRLALNKIINERYQEVKTKDLLILDEPTDGFSQQQINRMQPIFEKLNTSQMIIISHERNLDSFVTDIFHFQKENHITMVKKETS